MISRLMTVCGTVNEFLTAYKFGDAQQAAYSLWIDDVCNVYLELIKPVVYDTTDENKDARWAAQATLWIAMEAGLRLLHPMMPFVTEELWQRLPGRGTLGANESKTIMMASYPEGNKAYIDKACEESMATTMKVITACRSHRSHYNIANKVLTHFYVKISGDGEAQVKGQVDDIKTLGKASAVDVNPDDSDIPQSVGISIVDDQTTVLMDLTGLVDYKAEIAKLEKNLKKTVPSLESLKKKVNDPGYNEKASDDLKDSNLEKMLSLEKKASDINEAIVNFKRLAELEKK